MLVITRKLNDAIVIEQETGELIEIKLVEIGNQVRLGITAPKGCKIWRKELYQTVLENRSAAEAPKETVRNLASKWKESQEKH